MTPSPNDFLSVKAAAETLGCSRTMIYKMMAADPDFQPDAYIGRSPKFQRRTIERKRQRLIEQRHIREKTDDFKGSWAQPSKGES